MKILKKILSVLLNIIIYLIILVAIILVIIMLNTKKNGVSNVFGYVPLSIQTESMEPTIMTGDLVITKISNDTEDLQVGDIISFFAVEQNKTIIKTHRITEVKKTSISTSYITKGDNNEAVDADPVAPGDIVSIYEGTKLNGVGKILDFLKSKWGFFCCIIIPLAVFFIYQVYHFIVVVIDEKKKAAIMEIRANKKN